MRPPKQIIKLQERPPEEALKAARQMPRGPERIEALKQAGRLRMAADRKQIQFTPLGRPPKGMNAKGTISVAR
jgi:hypothetical protein